MNASRVVTVLLLVCTLGCERSSPASEAPKPMAEPSPAPSAQAKPAQASRVPPIDVALVRARFDAWLDAQNRQDFAAYSSLYATRMYGEKRAGTRLYKYDRKGWLADRERMFKKPMSVRAEDIQISSEALTASVTFVQAFAQGNFEDRGPKRIAFVREGGELRISTEIMLESTLTTQPVEAAKDFFFVVQIGDKSYAVLQEGVPRIWGTGAPSAPHDTENGAYVVLQGTAGLPAEQAALSGRVLRVFAATGEPCGASVGALKLMAAVIPHFGTVQGWRGEYGADGSPVPEAARVPEKPEAIAAQLLAEVDDADLALVGELSGCQGLFATSPERSVEVFAKGVSEASEQEAAGKVFRGLSFYRHALADYSKAMREAPEEPVAADWPETTVLDAFGGSDGYVAVTGSRGSGCAAYTDALTAILRREKGGLVEVAAARNASMPVLVIDLDRDGTLELITGKSDFADRGLTRFTKGEAIRLRNVPVSFHDCGC